MTNCICKITINNCEVTNYICKIAINNCKVTINNCEMTNYICKIAINNYKIYFDLIYIMEGLSETAGKKNNKKITPFW